MSDLFLSTTAEGCFGALTLLVVLLLLWNLGLQGLYKLACWFCVEKWHYNLYIPTLKYKLYPYLFL